MFELMGLPLDQKITVNRFLNRLLGLPLSDQERLFSAFARFMHNELRVANDTTVANVGRKTRSGQTVALPGNDSSFVTPFSIVDGTSWSDILAMQDRHPRCTFAQQKTSKRLVCAFPHATRTDMVRLVRPNTPASARAEYITQSAFENKYKLLSNADAKRQWKMDQPESYPAYLISGGVLPIWSLLENAIRRDGGRALEVSRVQDHIGILLSERMLRTLSANLGHPISGPIRLDVARVRLDEDDDD